MIEEVDIPLDEIHVDEALQTRALAGPVDPKLVEEYADELRRGVSFPPIDVFTGDWTPPGKRFAVVDGFHRESATRLVRDDIGATTIRAHIHEGTRRDALKFSIGANHSHGQRASNADKRKKVNLLLDDAEWVGERDTELARMAGVSSMFVGNVRRERAGALNGLTNEPTAVVTVSDPQALLSALAFVMPAVAKGKVDPRLVQQFIFPTDSEPPAFLTDPPREEPPHPHLDTLAAALGVTADSRSIRIDEVQAERLVEALGDLKPGEFASEPNPHPNLERLCSAFSPRDDWWFFSVDEARAKRILERLGDVKPGDLAPAAANSILKHQ